MRFAISYFITLIEYDKVFLSLTIQVLEFDNFFSHKFCFPICFCMYNSILSVAVSDENLSLTLCLTTIWRLYPRSKGQATKSQSHTRVSELTHPAWSRFHKASGLKNMLSILMSSPANLFRAFLMFDVLESVASRVFLELISLPVLWLPRLCSELASLPAQTQTLFTQHSSNFFQSDLETVVPDLFRDNHKELALHKSLRQLVSCTRS